MPGAERPGHPRRDHRHRRSKTHLRMGIPEDWAEDEDRVGNWPGQKRNHSVTSEEAEILWGRADGELGDGEEDDGTG